MDDGRSFIDTKLSGMLSSNGHVTRGTWPNVGQSKKNTIKGGVSHVHVEEIKSHTSIRLSPLTRGCGNGQFQHSSSPTSLPTMCRRPMVTSPSCRKTFSINKGYFIQGGDTNQSVVSSSGPLIPSKSDDLTESNQNVEECRSSPLFSNHCFGKVTRFTPLSDIGSANKLSHYSTGCDVGSKEEENIKGGGVFGEILTDDLLREWTGWEDLQKVVSADFRVDAMQTIGVDTLSERLPLVNSLKLSNSNIPQIRMLGTKFMNLKRLWIGSSHVQNLRGIGACAPALEELYASFNSVHDIAPLLDISETLEVVDLEGNAIQDMDSLLGCLSLLKKVKYLTLKGNPVVMFTAPSVTLDDGGKKDKLPTMDCFYERKQRSLNDVSYSKQSSTHVDPLNVSLCDEYMFLQECIRECGFDALEAAVAEETSAVGLRPHSSSSRIHTRCSSSASWRRSQRLGNLPHPVNSSIATSKGVKSERSGRPVCRRKNSFCSTLPLTSGQALTGGAVNLRHRLQPLQPLKVHASDTNPKNDSDNQSGDNSSSGHRPHVVPVPPSVAADTDSLPQRCKFNLSIPLPPRVDDNLEAPLFDDDEDEWEEYKQNLKSRINSRRAGVEYWAKYVTTESALSSQGDGESQGLSVLSGSADTRTTSTSSDPTVVQSVMKKQIVPPTEEEVGQFNTVTTGVTCSDKLCEMEDEDENEEAWRQELLRSVLESRMQTARVALDTEGLRVGDEDVFACDNPETF